MGKAGRVLSQTSKGWGVSSVIPISLFWIHPFWLKQVCTLKGKLSLANIICFTFCHMIIYSAKTGIPGNIKETNDSKSFHRENKVFLFWMMPWWVTSTNSNTFTKSRLFILKLLLEMCLQVTDYLLKEVPMKSESVLCHSVGGRKEKWDTSLSPSTLLILLFFVAK